jgi:hypothetical protein
MQNHSNEGYIIAKIKVYQIHSFKYTLVWNNSGSYFLFLTVYADFWKGDTEYNIFSHVDVNFIVRCVWHLCKLYFKVCLTCHLSTTVLPR